MNGGEPIVIQWQRGAVDIDFPTGLLLGRVLWESDMAVLLVLKGNELARMGLQRRELDRVVHGAPSVLAYVGLAF